MALPAGLCRIGRRKAGTQARSTEVDMRLPIWVVDVACAGCVRDRLAGPHRPGPMAGWPTRSARSAAVISKKLARPVQGPADRPRGRVAWPSYDRRSAQQGHLDNRAPADRVPHGASRPRLSVTGEHLSHRYTAGDGDAGPGQ